MDLGDIATWVGGVGAVVAAGVAVGAERRARKSAVDAATEASRAVTAAEETARAQSRLADIAEAQAARYRTPWTMRHRTSDKYEIVNAGDEPAYGVEVSGRAIVGANQPVRAARIDINATLDFFGARADFDDDLDETIVVRWHRKPDQSDEQLTWSCPLPPKPYAAD
ncbi:hypothetical protein ACFVKB_39110 [Rhodococcus sp. NPDC127530]|uniref:hypothetical protein n=1 Tax=unclassified Rhodococcus (in: high G+C Gram-positive bacteria) TaxID=192944 RepID=UPI0036303FAF